MHLKTILMLVVVLTLASGAWAQTKISITSKCGDFEPVYTVPVGDSPDHTFLIGKGKCTPTKPREIGGIAVRGEEITFFGEQSGNRARGRAVGVGTMANGDKYYFRDQFVNILKEQVLQTGESTWTNTGGTGKLKGLKGKGTCKGKPGPEKTEIWECEGEYQLPQ